MNDVLRLIGQRDGAVIRNCLAKLRHFCHHDAFPHYDLVGYLHEPESDKFQPELLHATNSAMLARSPREAWTCILGKRLPVLVDIPTDVDLVESSDAEYLAAREHLRVCYLALTKRKYITDMVASKMLYLKRPRLVAISDSYIREALGVGEPDKKLHPLRAPYYTARGLAVADMVRAVGKANLATLDDPQEELVLQSSPTRVSKARIVDILVWVDMAITRHENWTRWATERGWLSIATDIRAVA